MGSTAATKAKKAPITKKVSRTKTVSRSAGLGDPTLIPEPIRRDLRVYAFDPSAGQALGNVLTLSVPYETLDPGPAGRRFAVVDYDGENDCWYDPLDLNDPRLQLTDGLAPTEADPRFHQQMVYAVASETLEQFELALGRRVHWRRRATPHGSHSGSIHVLHLYPHAMQAANAFYCPDAHGILFGYFRADNKNSGRNLPGQAVFTALSHDVIVHEVTHAIIDGIRTYFTEPSNIDVPAFHEGFADIAALFRHFAHREVLLDTLQKTGGRLYQYDLKPEAEPANSSSPTTSPMIQAQLRTVNPLAQLAQQFGEASGMRSGLRSALDTPVNSNDYDTKTEPHDRGAILVSAIFDAYFTVYTRRTSDLFQIYHAGGGGRSAISDELPGPLAERLADAAASTANEFFALCVRALDYCPPVDITFGDFLRSLITADLDQRPDDPDGVRDALMQAFRLRGIVPNSSDFFSEESLRWLRVRDGALPPVEGLEFGCPNGLTLVEQDNNGRVLRDYVHANSETLGLDEANGEITVPSFHTIWRTAADGRLCMDMVVEIIQTEEVPFDESEPGRTFPLRSGITMLITLPELENGSRQPPQIGYMIHKHVARNDAAKRDKRIQDQRSYYKRAGLIKERVGNQPLQMDFALVHDGN